MNEVLPKLSICIPAFNRAEYLPPLLDSIYSQKYENLEIVIAEDNSPERLKIAEVVENYRGRGHNNIRYFENQETLGFDGNLRSLFARASGDYCVMMGNDDLLCPHSLEKIGSILGRHPEVAVVIRSYGWFYNDPSVVDQVVRYFPETCLFAPGEDTSVTFFRRVGVLAGLVFRRADAVAVATKEFDGTLYYQVYLAGRLLLQAHGLYLSHTVALCREGRPDFGQSKAEKGKFEPGQYTSDARITMIESMLSIAASLDSSHGTAMRPRVLKDLGNYSYYFLAFQADSGFRNFFPYYRRLGELGFRSNPLFHLYFWSLALLGKANSEKIVKVLRKKMKATPRLGKIKAGITLRNAE